MNLEGNKLVSALFPLIGSVQLLLWLLTALGIVPIDITFSRLRETHEGAYVPDFRAPHGRPVLRETE